MDETMKLQRRQLVFGALAGAALWPIGSAAAKDQASTSTLFDIVGDDGQPLPNYRLPNELSVTDLPGIIWVGSSNPDVILVEFFDYNCPYCRKASGDLDKIVASDKEFRLGLVNNAIIGLGSVLAAKVQQAVLKLYGPKHAYEFHKELLAHRGTNDGLSALDIAKKMKLDTTAIETAADSDEVRDVLTRQVKLASSLGFAATPSFMMKNVGILGYPGPKSIQRMIAAVRKCDKLVCA
jgi:protein-disulfide isomerase